MLSVSRGRRNQGSHRFSVAASRRAVDAGLRRGSSALTWRGIQSHLLDLSRRWLPVAEIPELQRDAGHGLAHEGLLELDARFPPLRSEETRVEDGTRVAWDQ